MIMVYSVTGTTNKYESSCDVAAAKQFSSMPLLQSYIEYLALHNSEKLHERGKIKSYHWLHWNGRENNMWSEISSALSLLPCKAVNTNRPEPTCSHDTVYINSCSFSLCHSCVVNKRQHRAPTWLVFCLWTGTCGGPGSVTALSCFGLGPARLSWSVCPGSDSLIGYLTFHETPSASCSVWGPSRITIILINI